MKPRSGFTLVELIVTLAIISIVTVAVVSLLSTGMNIFNRQMTAQQAKTVGDEACAYITSRCAATTRIYVVEGEAGSYLPGDRSEAMSKLPPGSSWLNISDGGSGKKMMEEGRLFFRNGKDEKDALVDIFGESYYGNQAITMRAEILNENALKITVAVLDARDGTQLYETSETVGALGGAFGVDEAGVYPRLAGGQKYPLSFPSQPGNAVAIGLFTGYVEDSSLLMRLDGIYNALDENGKKIHDANATALWTDITGHGYNATMHAASTGVLQAKEKAQKATGAMAYCFDGDGDYGEVSNLLLSGCEAVTVEICFRSALPNKIDNGMLFEYSDNWNNYAGSFGASLNDGHGAAGQIHTVARVGGYEASSTAGARNIVAAYDTKTFTTLTMVMTRGEKGADGETWVEDPSGRTVFVNGEKQPFGGKHTGSEASMHTDQVFGDYPLYFAGRGGSGTFEGEIAAVRIYARKLADLEIAQNAAEDAARFG